jgi:hypothetical protein
MRSDGTDGDAPDLCSAPSVAERLDFDLETQVTRRQLEEQLTAGLLDGKRRFVSWLSLRKAQ